MKDDDVDYRGTRNEDIIAGRPPATDDPAADFRRAVVLAKAMYGGFYYCPTTRRILERLHGDDKVLCGCGRSNPKVPTECTERTGVHIVRFLEAATAEAYVTQIGTARARRVREQGSR